MSDPAPVDQHFPGRSDLSLEAISDRLAIMNLLGAYAHYANMADFAGWCSLFTEDATFAISAPGAPGQPLPVKLIFAAERIDFAGRAQILERPASNERKWYYLVDPYIIEQTADFAKITVDLINLRILPEGPAPRIQNCAKYSGSLVKRQSDWKLHRWAVDSCRVPEPLSELPATWWVNVAGSETGDWKDRA